MKQFARISENQVTKAIFDGFQNDFKDFLNTEVIIVGAGPSGLVAARELARDGVKVLVVESNNYLGGGFWIGGFLMNTLTFRAPAQAFLQELGIPYAQAEPGLFTASGPHACSRLILAACEAGAKFLNMTKFDDVVLRNNRVEGVVVNWTPVSALPRAITCVDPISFEAKVVIDATGHDAWVCKSLEKRNLIKLETYGPMDINTSEDMVVEKTGQIYPGLIVSGMAVSTAYGIARMGPTFGGMLLSGKKAAAIARNMLLKEAMVV